MLPRNKEEEHDRDRIPRIGDVEAFLRETVQFIAPDASHPWLAVALVCFPPSCSGRACLSASACGAVIIASWPLCSSWYRQSASAFTRVAMGPNVRAGRQSR